MTAIDLNRGEHLWMQPTGAGDHYRTNEAVAHLDLPPLGGDGRTGPLLTRTLLIQGEAPGGRGGGDPGKLVARDKRTGRVVAEVELPRAPIGTPMTYLHRGRQYVALTIEGSPPELIALALPLD
jgi:quinoprotein glucose dehydrogenase